MTTTQTPDEVWLATDDRDHLLIVRAPDTAVFALDLIGSPNLRRQVTRWPGDRGVTIKASNGSVAYEFDSTPTVIGTVTGHLVWNDFIAPQGGVESP